MKRMVVVLSGMLSFFAVSSVAFALDFSGKTLLQEEAGGRLFSVAPPSGTDKDTVLLLELNGSPYMLGYQHGLLMAREIADVVESRYACGVFTGDAQEWVSRAFLKMP